MLIVPGGHRVGCVSGGCLEGELVRKAWWFTESGAPVIRAYDTTSQDDAVWEFGLGCNGVVHVMLERVNTPGASEALEFIDAHRACRKPVAVATVISSDGSSGVRVGERLLLSESGRLGGNLAGSRLESGVLAHSTAALREKKSRLAHLRHADVFVEWIGPPLPLVVFGAGHDVIPLVAFAARLGWDVTVVDGRPDYARAERFPDARKVLVSRGGNHLQDVSIDPETAVVMMTHNYPLDSVLLPRILSFQPCYLGLLGPRARAQRLFSELQLSEPAYLHAPAGLDAGSDSPEAIALSIVAEIQAVTNSRPGGKLKHRPEPIHSSVLEVGVPSPGEPASVVRPAWCETAMGNHA
jgi:xanthine dehydrogenase accessory factor